MNVFHCTTGALLLSVGLSVAQEPPTGTPTPGSQPPRNQQPQDPDNARSKAPNAMQAAAETDAVLATWLVVDNENEIALARIAQQRATNPEVKQFAQKMIDDHGKLLQKLQQAAGTRGQMDTSRAGDPRQGDPNRPAGERTRNPDERQPSDTTRQPSDASGVRATGAMAGAFDHKQLIRELGKQCLASQTKALEEKQGAEFDRCFMGMQLAAHMQAVDKITVFRNHASSNLRAALDEGLTVVQTHLQHAKELAKRTDELAAADVRR